MASWVLQGDHTYDAVRLHCYVQAERPSSNASSGAPAVLSAEFGIRAMQMLSVTLMVGLIFQGSMTASWLPEPTTTLQFRSCRALSQATSGPMTCETAFQLNEPCCAWAGEASEPAGYSFVSPYTWWAQASSLVRQDTPKCLLKPCCVLSASLQHAQAFCHVIDTPSAVEAFAFFTHSSDGDTDSHMHKYL